MNERLGENGTVRLSVIVPGYNTARGLWNRCVTSVMRATRPCDEIILVDDGSDGGAVFLDHLGCRVIHKGNGGLSSARNAGLEAALGEFVTFVDSDDEVVVDVYERALEQLEATHADVCLFGVQTIWQDIGMTKVDVVGTECYGELKPADVGRLSKRCLMNYAWNKVYRREVLEAKHMRFDSNGVPCEDIIFNLQVALTGCSWCAVNCVGYHYFRADGTLLSCFKKTNVQGLSLCRDTWRRYKRAWGEESDALGTLGEITSHEIILHEWNNIWCRQSPYGLCERWKFLISHKDDIHGPSLVVFFRKLLFILLRKYLYVPMLRRWHVKRLYPNVESF